MTETGSFAPGSPSNFWARLEAFWDYRATYHPDEQKRHEAEDEAWTIHKLHTELLPKLWRKG